LSYAEKIDLPGARRAAATASGVAVTMLGGDGRVRVLRSRSGTRGYQMQFSLTLGACRSDRCCDVGV